MFAPPDPYAQKQRPGFSPAGQESVFKTMARRAVPPPRAPIRQAPPVRAQAPIRQPNAVQPGPPQPGAPPPPPQMDPPTGGGFMSPPPGPGTGGGFMAQPPQATASSADVNLGPNFDAERARRLMIAQRMRSGGGTFQY
jgi:hypothetical protein